MHFSVVSISVKLLQQSLVCHPIHKQSLAINQLTCIQVTGAWCPSNTLMAWPVSIFQDLAV